MNTVINPHALVLVLVIISSASSLNASFKLRRRIFDRTITANMVETSKQSSSSSSSSSRDESDKMLTSIEALLKAAESGNIEELRRQGFALSSKNEADALLERISDPTLRDQILGQMSIDELELLEDMKRVSADDSFEGYEGGDIDKELFEEIQQEASSALDNIRKGESSMATLLGDDFADIVKDIDPSKIESWKVRAGQCARAAGLYGGEMQQEGGFGACRSFQREAFRETPLS
jgi:hypothetical protein